MTVKCVLGYYMFLPYSCSDVYRRILNSNRLTSVLHNALGKRRMGKGESEKQKISITD